MNFVLLIAISFKKFLIWDVWKWINFLRKFNAVPGSWSFCKNLQILVLILLHLTSTQKLQLSHWTTWCKFETGFQQILHVNFTTIQFYFKTWILFIRSLEENWNLELVLYKSIFGVSNLPQDGKYDSDPLQYMVFFQLKWTQRESESHFSYLFIRYILVFSNI